MRSLRKIADRGQRPLNARWSSETRLEISTDEVDYIMIALAGEIRAIFRGSLHISRSQAADAADDVKNDASRNEVCRR